MTGDVSYDPYDRELLADPYPAFRRLRDEAPLYYNEQYDFYAVTRFADVEQAMLNRKDLVTSRGTILEMVKSGIEIPPGTLIMEEGPRHAIHRQLLSRVFTPKAMLAIEPQVHEFCAARLDELAGRDSFDFVVDFAQYVPMRVFGMLLGIPEEEQERVRAHVEAGFQSEAGKPREYTEHRMGAEFYEEFVDHRYAHPGDDLITRLLTTEFDDEHGVRRTLTRDEALIYLAVIAGAGNHTTNRLIGWTGKILGEHADARRELVADRSLVPNAIEEVLRYEPPSPHPARYAVTDTELCGQTIPEGSALLCVIAGGEPRRAGVRRPRPLRHPPGDGSPPHVRLRRALLPGRVAGPPRGPGRARRAARPLPRLGARPRPRRTRHRAGSAGLHLAPGPHPVSSPPHRQGEPP